MKLLLLVAIARFSLASSCDFVLERLTQTFKIQSEKAELLAQEWRAAGKTEAQILTILNHLPPLPDSASAMRNKDYMKALEILSQESRPVFPDKLTPADQVALAILQRESKYQSWFARVFTPTLLDLRFRKWIKSATADQELPEYLGAYDKARYYAVGDFLLRSNSKEDLLARIDANIEVVDRQPRQGGFFKRWVTNRNYRARLQSLRKLVEAERTGWIFSGSGIWQSSITDPSRRFRKAVIVFVIGYLFWDCSIPAWNKLQEFFSEDRPVSPTQEIPLERVPASKNNAPTSKEILDINNGRFFGPDVPK